MLLRFGWYLFFISVLMPKILFASNSLIDVATRLKSSSESQILLTFKHEPQKPTSFFLEEPAKLVFDFADVMLDIAANKVKQQLQLGELQGLQFANNKSDTRLILDVSRSIPYDVDVFANKIVITLKNIAATNNSYNKNITNKFYTINSIDFNRTEDGAGRFIINLNNKDIAIDFKEEKEDIIVSCKNASINDNLLRKYNVVDFGTPIKNIFIQRHNNDVIFRIIANGDYEKMAYQIGAEYIVEAKPLTNPVDIAKSQKFKYTGEKISLNYQDVEVRSVLDTLANFSNLNIIASDSVAGKITLKLDNIPWDQALEHIMKTKGLAKREEGNVLLIGLNSEIANREKEEREAQKSLEDLEPLKTEYIAIKYAKSADLAVMLKDENNSILSERGVVSSDERTNTLLIKETSTRIAEIKNLLKELDIPVRQVLIETQLVETTHNFNDALGIQFGGAATAKIGKYRFGLSNNRTDAATIADSNGALTRATSGLFFDSVSSGVVGLLGLSVARLPGGTLLDLELRALEAETKGKVISRPKLMTQDKKTAVIENGREIPYVTNPGDGADPTVTFKKAVLKLEVTPHITPDNKVAMELTINRDSLGSLPAGISQAPVNTTSLKTNVLVENGETIVLGGIFVVDTDNTETRVPFFGKLPIVGRVFKSNTTKNNRNEVLIFVTPRIIKEGMLG